ncbi:hypothetical protein C8R47DRAFT_513238 [Mycena vitilis]|nr:hypothetical protein C8R47DRAFT_513238 [Mycena vitilis]
MFGMDHLELSPGLSTRLVCAYNLSLKSVTSLISDGRGRAVFLAPCPLAAPYCRNVARLSSTPFSSRYASRLRRSAQHRGADSSAGPTLRSPARCSASDLDDVAPAHRLRLAIRRPLPCAPRFSFPLRPPSKRRLLPLPLDTLTTYLTLPLCPLLVGLVSGCPLPARSPRAVRSFLSARPALTPSRYLRPSGLIPRLHWAGEAQTGVSGTAVGVFVFAQDTRRH